MVRTCDMNARRKICEEHPRRKSCVEKPSKKFLDDFENDPKKGLSEARKGS